MDERFELYYNLLKEWNEKFNLTAITEKDKIELLHFKDSILPEDLIKQNATVLDIGSGAGFPAIPLKIVRDDLDITMVDSLNKRVTFLNEVISKLNLERAKAVHKRAEDLDKNVKYDVVTARAVAPMRVLCEYCIPFVKKGGYFIPYKSGKADEEIAQARSAVKKLGGEMQDIIVKFLPETDVERTFVPVKKLAATAKQYPRKAGLPGKEPLKSEKQNSKNFRIL